MITAKHRLHFANGKDNTKEERLRPYDQAKHDIYKVLKEELPKATDWNELKESLSNRGIEMTFKLNRTTQEVQGVKFRNGEYTFSGSKIGREFSYMNIDYLHFNAIMRTNEDKHKKAKTQRKAGYRKISMISR